MIHKMRLIPKYFSYMEKGIKTIELRLNDEKRQKINVGDTIIFERLGNEPKYLETVVTNLYHEKTFKDLISKFAITSFAGENISTQELLNAIDEIYSKEEQEKYAALGIEIRIK